MLATDGYSATVIIEIKRSNQSARQALHELHKYVGLIKHNHGLRDSQIRCILVSTDWDELLVPFSEFSRTASWTIDGYRLHLRDGIIPEFAEKINPVAAPTELHLCAEHAAYLFREQVRRDEAVPVLLRLLRDHGLVDHLLLKLDIKQRRTEGTCDYALYLVIPEFSPDEREAARKRLANSSWADVLDESTRNLEEQLVLGEVSRVFHDSFDEFEIGYPEKLNSLSSTWEVTSLIRGGSRLGSTAVFSDKYLLRLARGLEGRNAVQFEMCATPRRRLSWIEIKQNSQYCLIGNEAWSTLIHTVLEDIERNDPSATVTARIYNPGDLLMGLYRLAKHHSTDSLPSAEIVISTEGGAPPRIICGSLAWNGKQVHNIVEVLPDGSPTLFDLYFASAIDSGPWAVNDYIVAQHGLSYVLIEYRFESGATVMEQLVIRDGAIERRSFTQMGLAAFCVAHQLYLQALVVDVDSWARFG